MGNHVAIAALVADAAGAVLLARGIAFQTADLYAQENPAALYPRSTDIPRDAARARDVADAQAGAALLVLGFIGQALAAWQPTWDTLASLAAYGIAAVSIGVALRARVRLARRFERELYIAHVAREFRRWEDEVAKASRRAAQEEYREYLTAHGRESELDDWGARALRQTGVDPRSWEAPLE